jgi:hypothetical protein
MQSRVTGYGTVKKYDDPNYDVFFGPPHKRADNFASMENFKVTFFGVSGWW